MIKKMLFVVALVGALAGSVFAESGTPILINCQGRLFDGEKLLNGDLSMTLRIYTNATTGNYLYEDISTVTVVDGVYSTYLGDDTTKGDLVSALSTGEAFLEVVADGITFSPRERLVAVPYALVAERVVHAGVTADMLGAESVLADHLADGTVTANKLATDSVNTASIMDGGVTTEDLANASVTPEKLKLTYWTTAGNVRASKGTEFMGTLDKRAVDIRANKRRILLLEPNETSPNIIAGHEVNYVGEEVAGATISGGGQAGSENKVNALLGVVSGGSGNEVTGEHGVISGGWSNQAAGSRSVVSGGRENIAEGPASAIGGGYSNRISGSYAVIPGGYQNQAIGYVATVGGGWGNLATGVVSVVSGGQDNRAFGSASVVGGGWQNEVSGYASVVAGGATNNASGRFATIPGGSGNQAQGKNSLAAGQGASANHDGTFVWSDNKAEGLSSTAENQFIIQAAGNVGIDTDAPDEKLTVNGNVKATSFIGDGSQLTGVQAMQVGEGSIGNAQLAGDAAIAPEKIAGVALTQASAFKGMVQGTAENTAIASGAVGAEQIAKGSLANDHLAGDAAIAPEKIAGVAVTQTSVFKGMVQGTIENTSIATGAIGTEHVANASITAEKLDTQYWPMNVVKGKKGSTYLGTSDNTALALGVAGKEVVVIAGGKKGSVVTVQGADLGVDGTVAATRFVGDGSGLTNLKVEKGGLTESTQFDGDVSGHATKLEIKPGAITSSKIAEGAVTSSHLAESFQLPFASVTVDKLADGFELPPAAIVGGALTASTIFDGDVVGESKNLSIKPGAITGDKIAPASISMSHLASDVKLGADAIAGTALTESAQFGGDLQGTAGKLIISEGAITSGKLAAGSVGRGNLDPNLILPAKSIEGIALTADTKFNGDVSGQAGSLMLQKGVVTADQIVDGAITDDKLASRYLKISEVEGEASYALAMGRKAKSEHAGSFVWADAQGKSFGSTEKNQFLIRAAGNVGIDVDSPKEKLTVAGNVAPAVSRASNLGSDTLRWKSAYLSDQLDFSGRIVLSSAGRQLFSITQDGGLVVSGLTIVPGPQGPNVLGGHHVNGISAGVSGATVSGGGSQDHPNKVSQDYGTVGGGFGNEAQGFDSTIAGGQDNVAAGSASTIGGGYGNRTPGIFSTVAGGTMNMASGNLASLGGGFSNKVSGTYAVVPGGFNNEASGAYAVASGRDAKARHDGSFVWADATGMDFVSTANNQFKVRAGGGIWLYSSPSLGSGVKLSPGSGSWSILSDRNVKKDLVPMNDVEVMERLADMPVYSWKYKTADGAQHIGPMAQDFHSAFGAGDDERYISTVDADGVALSAIRGLHSMLEEKIERLEGVEMQNVELNGRVDDLEAQIKMLIRALELSTQQSH